MGYIKFQARRALPDGFAGWLRLAPVAGGDVLKKKITVGEVLQEEVPDGSYDISWGIAGYGGNLGVVEITSAHTESAPLDLQLVGLQKTGGVVIIGGGGSGTVGPRGPKGDKGDPGEKGPKGDPGDGGSILKYGSPEAGGDITKILQAALDDAQNSSVTLPQGDWTCGPITLKANASGVLLNGNGAKLTARPGIGSPLFTAPSTARLEGVTIRDLTIDMAWVEGAPAVNALQFTNASKIRIEACKIRNVGRAGIVAQGLSGSGGCPDFVVEGCVLENIGLEDKTTGIGILVQGDSPRAKVIGNTLTGVKGGAAIAGNGPAGAAPTAMLISANTVTMAQGAAPVDAINLTQGCAASMITENVVIESFGSGIGASAPKALIVANSVQKAWNHGLLIEGEGVVVQGNTVLERGVRPGGNYSVVQLRDPSRCVVVGNSGPSEGTHLSVIGNWGPGNVFGMNSWQKLWSDSGSADLSGAWGPAGLTALVCSGHHREGSVTMVISEGKVNATTVKLPLEWWAQPATEVSEASAPLLTEDGQSVGLASLEYDNGWKIKLNCPQGAATPPFRMTLCYSAG